MNLFLTIVQPHPSPPPPPLSPISMHHSHIKPSSLFLPLLPIVIAFHAVLASFFFCKTLFFFHSCLRRGINGLSSPFRALLHLDLRPSQFSPSFSFLDQYWYVLDRHPEQLFQVHDRVAQRWFDTCSVNGGLYIKLGQGIATMNHVLPQEYIERFSTLYDKVKGWQGWQLLLRLTYPPFVCTYLVHIYLTSMFSVFIHVHFSFLKLSIHSGTKYWI